MPRFHRSFAKEAGTFARQAQNESASLRRDLQALRNSLAGLSRAVYAPVPKGGSRVTRNTAGKLSFLQRAEQATLRSFVSGQVHSAVNSAFGSFYTSASQTAGQLSSLSDLAQRIL